MSRPTEPQRRRRGTATTETVLIIPVLLLVVGMTPWMAHMFLDLQVTRTEAHRDMFEKTTCWALMPETMMSNHVNSRMESQFGLLTEGTRQHALAKNPPEVPESVNNILDAPSSQDMTKGAYTLDLFDEGFPNNTVEGWEYIERPKALSVPGSLHFMAYGYVIRSPWTKLGWPWIPTQDFIAEPGKMQGWQGDLAKIDDEMRKRYKLAE